MTASPTPDTAQYVIVQFIGSNVFTRFEHGSPILFTPTALQEHGITRILRTQADIDDASDGEDEWYAMDIELLESAYGVTP